jgi:hypothetical protein
VIRGAKGHETECIIHPPNLSLEGHHVSIMQMLLEYSTRPAQIN